MNIAYFAPGTIHDAKWINHFAENKKNNVILFSRKNLNKKEHLYFSNKVDIHPILDSYSLYPYKKRKTKKKIEKILKDKKVQLCHCLYAVPYALWCNEFSLPYVITTRGSDIFQDLNLPNGPNNSIRKRVLNWLTKKQLIKSFKQSKYITSTSIKQQLVLKELVNESKLKLIRTGVNFNKLALIKKENPHKSSTIKILSPRNLMPFFNIHLILDGFAELIKKHQKKLFELHIIDNFRNSEYSKNLNEKIKVLNISKYCFFYPQQSMIEMAKLINQSDIIIMIPSTDGSPSSAIEAMYFEKPVILGTHKYDDDLFGNEKCWRLSSLSATCIKSKFEEIIFSPSKYVKKKTNLALKTVLNNADFSIEISKINSLYISLIKDE